MFVCSMLVFHHQVFLIKKKKKILNTEQSLNSSMLYSVACQFNHSTGEFTWEYRIKLGEDKWTVLWT